MEKTENLCKTCYYDGSCNEVSLNQKCKAYQPLGWKPESKMTEQELREKIAILFKNAREEGAIRKWADGSVDTEEVLALVKEAGYVKLAEDQTHPRNPHLGIPVFYALWEVAQQDMLKVVGGKAFRKVILEKK